MNKPTRQVDKRLVGYGGEQGNNSGLLYACAAVRARLYVRASAYSYN